VVYVLLVSLLTILAASPSVADWSFMPAADDAVVTSFWDSQPCPYDIAAFLEHMEAFLAIAMPTRPIDTFACRVRIEPEEPYIFLSVATDGWINTAEFPDFDLSPVGEPVVGDFVIMARIDLLILSDATEILYFIDPPEGQEVVEYTDPEGVVVELARFSGYSGAPDAIGNPSNWLYSCYPGPTESFTWSAVKSLYR